VVHTFTHFRLELSVRTGTGGRRAGAGEIWQSPGDLGALALPTVMKKVLARAL
jgi:adenine-specific DNA glycosylase